MRRFRGIVAVAAVVAALTPSTAQAQCTGAVAAQDACRKALDAFTFLAPQLASGITGGSAVMGLGNTVGGLGHVSVGLRANAVLGRVPKLADVGTSVTGARPSRYEDQAALIPYPTAEAEIGLFKGFGVGVTHLGGLDAIVSATYLPSADLDAVSVDAGSGFGFGYGARVGILDETLLVPGLSLTWVQRNLPTADLGVEVGAGGFGTAPATLGLEALDVRTSAWRVNVEKSLLAVGVSAGVGQDRYDLATTVRGSVSAAGTQAAATGRSDFSMTRTNWFVGLSLNIPFVRLVGEYGAASGGETPALLNDFGSRPNATRSYFSVGLRAKF